MYLRLFLFSLRIRTFLSPSKVRPGISTSLFLFSSRTCRLSRLMNTWQTSLWDWGSQWKLNCEHLKEKKSDHFYDLNDYNCEHLKKAKIHHFGQRGESVPAQFELLQLAQLVQTASLKDLNRCRLRIIFTKTNNAFHNSKIVTQPQPQNPRPHPKYLNGIWSEVQGAKWWSFWEGVWRDGGDQVVAQVQDWQLWKSSQLNSSEEESGHGPNGQEDKMSDYLREVILLWARSSLTKELDKGPVGTWRLEIC